MHRSTLFLLACATLAGGAAAGGTHAPDDWLTLDREIEALADLAPLQDKQGAQAAGVKVSGWIKTQYDHSNDVTVGGNDLGGFGFNGIRINVDGRIGDYRMRISANSSGGDFSVRDAYARTPLGENLELTVGQFKSRFLYSYYCSNDKLVFYRRNAIGDAWSTRDTGVEVNGRFGPILAVLSLQNGGDSAGDEWAMTAKAQWAAMGTMIERQSGGFGPDAETALTLGVGYFDDTTVSNSSAIAVEAIFASGPFFASAQAVSHDDGFGGIASGVAGKVDASGFADDTPWDVALACMLDEHWELAADYQDNDDGQDTATLRGGVNYYMSGHAAKWQANYASRTSDDDAKEVDMLTLGLVVAI